MTRRRIMRLWVIAAVACDLATRGQTTIDPANRYAYGANIGWTDWYADGANGARVSEFICSGHLYAANVGWIELGSGMPADGIRYRQTSASDFGVNHDGQGNLHGYAWAPNFGWLVFTNRAASAAAFAGPWIDFRTGRISGYVWSANAGWIVLSNAVATLRTATLAPAADVDQDGIADTWERLYFGNLAVAGVDTDSDRDGFSDVREYLADTDPTDRDAYLRVTAHTSGHGEGTTTVSWASASTRVYEVLGTPDASAVGSWVDVGLGMILPDAGDSTTRSFTDAPSAQGFYQVKARRPLEP